MNCDQWRRLIIVPKIVVHLLVIRAKMTIRVEGHDRIGEKIQACPVVAGIGGSADLSGCSFAAADGVAGAEQDQLVRGINGRCHPYGAATLSAGLVRWP